ncbi:hypothetical protein N752_03935 [Desulforamulus aquiferis]|nr:hypothetical protein [Desulforamulus aquiferis]RYD06486.1 hypothetical protein N752_03935 [Desulforamulus aquiferis]
MVALTFFSFTISGYSAPFRKLLWFGVFLAAFIWLIRLFSVPFGFHSLVGLFSLAIIVYKEVRLSLGKSFFVAFIAFFLLLILEMVSHIVMEKLCIFLLVGRVGRGFWLAGLKYLDWLVCLY